MSKHAEYLSTFKLYFMWYFGEIFMFWILLHVLSKTIFSLITITTNFQAMDPVAVAKGQQQMKKLFKE